MAVRAVQKPLLILVTGALLAGCGGASQPQTAGAVDAAYRAWNDATLSGDAAKACALMTQRFVQVEVAASRGTSKNCHDLISGSASITRKSPAAKRYKISGIVVDGDRATLIDTTPTGKGVDTARMSLVRTDGVWKVDGQAFVNKAPPDAPAVVGQTS